MVGKVTLQKSNYCRDKCRAWCCRNLIFTYNGTDSPVDMKMFFKLRNITYDEKTNEVIVPIKCNWITSHNRCKLYKFRPDICRAYECDKLKELEPLHYIL